MTRTIAVDYQPTEHTFWDGYWNCEHANTELEVWLEYQPSQEQIDMGTDHDVQRTGRVCTYCGEIVEMVQ